MKYVLGFAFDDVGRVALIRKLKPTWQAGKWNGIGGKVEVGEASYDAMVREFYEEAAVYVPHQFWHRAGSMIGSDWFVDVFTCTHQSIRMVSSATEELVQLWCAHEWFKNTDLLPNVPGLISLCGIVGERPFFTIDYLGKSTLIDVSGTPFDTSGKPGD